MQKALEATDGARQVASVVCRKKMGPQHKVQSLALWAKDSEGALHLGETLFVTHVGDQTISQLYHKMGSVGKGPQVGPVLIIHH